MLYQADLYRRGKRCPPLLYPARPCPALYCPAPPCAALPCPALPCPALAFYSRPCPALRSDLPSCASMTGSFHPRALQPLTALSCQLYPSYVSCCIHTTQLCFPLLYI